MGFGLFYPFIYFGNIPQQQVFREVLEEMEAQASLFGVTFKMN